MSRPRLAPRFRLTVDGEAVAFLTAAGLDIGHDIVECDDGMGHVFPMPAQNHPVDVSLRHGAVPRSAAFRGWLNAFLLDRIDRRNVAISLTSESGAQPLVTWHLVDAFPVRLSAPGLVAGADPVEVEQLDLRADRLTVDLH
ncbi:phage tail protein [Kitasatospora sp. NPDC008050]|uniref:phage tail protein n=1 Tax=Kitasatospora sp. NPDC008050 TaxID=3364021 RepID=UPI0036E3DFB7